MHRKSRLPAAACCLIILLVGQPAIAPAAPAPGIGDARALPHKGMSMTQVERSFGQPAKVLAAVGTPPITRWVYEGYTVYFDRDHVVHAVSHTAAVGGEALTAR